MGKVIKFPKGGRDAIDQEAQHANRKIVLEARLVELEKRSEHYREDIEYIGECLMADTEEMSQVLSELAWINGFNSSKSMLDSSKSNEELERVIFTPDAGLAKTLEDWLAKDKGTEHEDS